MSTQRQTRLDEILRLRFAQRYSYSEIGTVFGITKERVRQLLAGIGRDGQLTASPRPIPFPITGFRKAMRGWLWSYGFRRCGSCKSWLKLALFAPSQPFVCRGCKSYRVTRLRMYHKAMDHPITRIARPELFTPEYLARWVYAVDASTWPGTGKIMLWDEQLKSVRDSMVKTAELVFQELEARGITSGEAILNPAAFTPDQFAFLWWMTEIIGTNEPTPFDGRVETWNVVRQAAALEWDTLAKPVKDLFVNTMAAVFYRLLEMGILA